MPPKPSVGIRKLRCKRVNVLEIYRIMCVVKGRKKQRDMQIDESSPTK